MSQQPGGLAIRARRGGSLALVVAALIAGVAIGGNVARIERLVPGAEPPGTLTVDEARAEGVPAQGGSSTAASWRQQGRPPALAVDVHATVQVATRAGLVSVDVDERRRTWTRLPIAMTGHPNALALSAGLLVAPAGFGGVQAVPTGQGDPRRLDATMFVPAGRDAVWLLRAGSPWTAVRALGDGTELTEAVPLPAGTVPLAGLADTLVVTRAGVVSVWEPATRSTLWSVSTDDRVATGARRLAACPRATSDESPARRDERGLTEITEGPGCPLLRVVDAASGHERDVTGKGVVDFDVAAGAFSTADLVLAVPVHRSRGGQAIALVRGLDRDPRISALVATHGTVSGPLAWHPDGRWLFAAVDRRLVAIDAIAGSMFDAGVDLPPPVHGMVVARAPR